MRTCSAAGRDLDAVVARVAGDDVVDRDVVDADPDQRAGAAGAGRVAVEVRSRMVEPAALVVALGHDDEREGDAAEGAIVMSPPPSIVSGAMIGREAARPG